MSQSNNNIITDESIRSNSLRVLYSSQGIPQSIYVFGGLGTTTVNMVYSGGTGNLITINRYLNGIQIENLSITYGTSGLTSINASWT